MGVQIHEQLKNERQTDRQTDRHRQTNRQTDTDRQTDRDTHREQNKNKKARFNGTVQDMYTFSRGNLLFHSNKTTVKRMNVFTNEL